MAIAAQSIVHYSQGPPAPGEVIYDAKSNTHKMYDGSNWITFDAADTARIAEIQARLKHRQNITDEYLHREYPDLKELKEEYKALADKYRVFEVLKRDNQ